MGMIHCPEPSVLNYQSTLRNISEERKPHLHRGGGLKIMQCWSYVPKMCGEIRVRTIQYHFKKIW